MMTSSLWNGKLLQVIIFGKMYNFYHSRNYYNVICISTCSASHLISVFVLCCLAVYFTVQCAAFFFSDCFQVLCEMLSLHTRGGNVTACIQFNRASAEFTWLLSMNLRFVWTLQVTDVTLWQFLTWKIIIRNFICGNNT